MSKKMYWLIGALVVLVASFAVTYCSIGQTKTPSSDVIGPASVPTRMFVRGYTGYPDDLEHCFVQDYGGKKRPLFFDAYVDKPVDDAQIDLKLYRFKDGSPTLVEMKQGKDEDWYVYSNSKDDKKFTIKINKDKNTRPPHLGPGPYMALIPISSMTKDALYFSGYYYYGT